MQCPSCRASVEGGRFCPSCGASLAVAAAAAPADPMIGQVLGAKYTVVRLLGEGGMGAVYEGEQQLGATKRRVAVKTLHPHLSRDPKIKARFEREVATIAELLHPNTIQVYDFGEAAGGVLYIVMELLDGRSLADLLEKEGALPPDRARGVIEQVCGSLEEAHGRGIVHRDLKPDNVVLVERAGKKDFVKVLDFGIAKRSRDEEREEQKLTQQGMVLGTPPYMSPEQFAGGPVDLRSDVYSLGVMAYEMLTGKLPFEADTAWEWAAQHMTQPPIPIESLAGGARAPEAMRAALRRALAKAPEDRFQSARDFFAAFAGEAPSRGAAAVVVAGGPGASPWEKTALGAPPLEAIAALGAPAPAAAPPAPAHAFTPVGGNVSFPTSAGIPRPPPRASDEAPGRRKLLVAAGVIGVASVAAIAFAMKGPGPRGPAKRIVLDEGNEIAPAPATSLSAAAVVDPIAPAAAAPTRDVPPLSAAAAHPQSPPRVAPAPAGAPAAAKASPQPSSSPSAAPIPTPTPITPPAQPPEEPSRYDDKYDGVECTRARMLRRMGRRREAERWARACAERGGDPD